MCAVLLPVFGYTLGGSSSYRVGKGVQFVAGQPVGEAVFDQCVGCVLWARTLLFAIPNRAYRTNPTQPAKAS